MPKRTSPTITLDQPRTEVYFGDARQLNHLVEPETVHLVVTSPPYWNAKDYGDPQQIGFGQSYSSYLESLNEVWDRCVETLVPNGKLAVVIQALPVSGKETGLGRSSIVDIMADTHQHLKGRGVDLSNQIIWDKRKYNNQRIFGSYPYPPNFFSHVAWEMIYVFRKRGAPVKRPKEEKERSKLSMKEWSNWCFNSMWDIPPVIKVNSKGENWFGHLAPYPEELIYRLVRMFTFEGDLVLDPFLGSATTLRVTRATNRRGIGVELDQSLEPLVRQRLDEPWSRKEQTEA